MTYTLRAILIICSIISFALCIRKIKQAKLKVSYSIIWIIGSIILILMSIFSKAVEWISRLLGFAAPVNFVFLVIIGFLLIEMFISNIKLSMLNEKIKNLNHYIALKEYEDKNSAQNKEE